jgi:hypothetical protein
LIVVSFDPERGGACVAGRVAWQLGVKSLGESSRIDDRFLARVPAMSVTLSV